MRLTRRDVLHVNKGRRSNDAVGSLPPAPLEEGDLVDVHDYADAFEVEVYEASSALSDLPSPGFTLEELDVSLPDAVRVLSVTPEDGQYRVVAMGPQPGLRIQFYVTPED